MTCARHPAKLRTCFFLLLSAVLLCAGTMSSTTLADAPQIRFEALFDPANTISQQMGGVNSILHDQLGFVWIGAENGLARYDGRILKLYQADPANPRTLPSNFVWQTLVDKEGVLWITTEGGLARYQVETDDFARIDGIGGATVTGKSVTSLALAADNTLYVGAARGLYAISPDRNSITFHLPEPPLTMVPGIEQIRFIAIDHDEKVWLGTAGMGAAIFDPKTESFKYLLHEPGNSNSLTHNSVRSILHDDQNRVWLGTYGNGISVLDKATGLYTHFSSSHSQPGTLKSNVIWDIIQDSEGVIWLALDQGGLARFDEATRTFHHYLHRPYDSSTLISNQLRVIYEDHNRDIWLGAFPSGISFYDRSSQIFRQYTTKPDDPHSLSHNAILRIIEASDNTIWVGTEGGLNALDPETGHSHRYLANPDDPEALNANAVLAIQEDIDGQLWIGTWSGGLHRLNPATGKFKRYLPDGNDPDSINSVFIWDIIRDREDRIWIASETGGLSRYNRLSDSFTHYTHDPDRPESISSNFVTSLLEDRRGHLWMCGYSGVNVFDPDKETFTHIPYETGKPDATNSKDTKPLFEDSKGRVWIGTYHHGVNVYDPQTSTFSYLGVADGLPSANVSSVVEDDRGYIWLATANGLASISPDSGGIAIYGREDGLAGNNFIREAALKDSKGYLYFGSSEGITRFQPDELHNNSEVYPVRLTNFLVFNQSVSPGEGSPLNRSIAVAKQITLQHKDRMFSFEFAALNYRNAESMHYSYRLDGFDQRWNDIGRRATATYTNINPGDYTFRIRASIANDHWVEGQSIKVKILPPIWRSWWAYSLYAVFLLIALYLRNDHVKLQARAEAYKTKSVTDPLTHLYNRLGIAQIAEGVFANNETQKGMSLLLLDIDYFKQVNDQRGHDAGDRVLVEIANIMISCVRQSDRIGRWGGEEFVLLFANQKQGSQHYIAEKIRAAIEQHIFEPGPAPLKVTVSIGVSDILPGDTFATALKRADLALYQAKERGRNCVVKAAD